MAGRVKLKQDKGRARKRTALAVWGRGLATEGEVWVSTPDRRGLMECTGLCRLISGCSHYIRRGPRPTHRRRSAPGHALRVHSEAPVVSGFAIGCTK